MANRYDMLYAISYFRALFSWM